MITEGPQPLGWWEGLFHALELTILFSLSLPFALVGMWLAALKGELPPI